MGLGCGSGSEELGIGESFTKLMATSLNPKDLVVLVVLGLGVGVGVWLWGCGARVRLWECGARVKLWWCGARNLEKALQS